MRHPGSPAVTFEADLMEPPALKVRQVAALLQTTTDNVRALIHDGHIAAVKLDPDCDDVGRASEWRIQRSALDRWLGPWRPPSIVAASPPESTRPSQPGDGGPSRETLRDRAGLAPDPGPSTYPAADAASDAPSGSVPPVHPEDATPRPVVRLHGITTVPEHPSERYLPADDREALARQRQAEADRARRSMDTALAPGRHRQGSEPPHPIDPSTFGAGPAAA